MGHEGHGDGIVRADLGQAGPVAACDGGVAVLMEGSEAVGSAGWPIRHELGRPSIGWRVRMRSEAGRLPTKPSGGEREGAQPVEGATELGFPGPALGKVQGEAACRAGEPSGEGEEAAPQGLDRHDLLTEADARRPAGQVVGDHLDGQPVAVGGEAARGEMVEPDAVLEVSDGILDLGVASMVGLQFQGVPLPVGDEGVIVEDVLRGMVEIPVLRAA